MVLHFARGSKDGSISDADLQRHLVETLTKLGKRERVCLVPPDYTRFHSNAGILTQACYEHYGGAVKDIMPALGTHAPITDEQRIKMFGEVPKDLFRVHDWRNDVVKVGEVPAELVREASDGKVSEPWPAQLNKLIWEGDHDLVLSIGQVVPHEVLGMANYNKNLFVGVGGADAINFSHFIGAVYGMERMMGRADNPLRRILNYASDKFLKPRLPILYALTVVARDDATGNLVNKGLFIGDDVECFHRAAALSLEVNFTMLEEPLHKVVVYLNEEEFHSTWLGNKSIYRTRMAIADGGELIVLAPGVREFGEDPRIDELIRKHGYRTTPEVLAAVESSRDLMKNLSAAAHLMHGSTENRFKVTYCPGHLTKQEVESVGYNYADLGEMSKVYDIKKLQDGWNTVNGEKIFYISNPAVGLWVRLPTTSIAWFPETPSLSLQKRSPLFFRQAYRKRFEESGSAASAAAAGVGGGGANASNDDTDGAPVGKKARIEPTVPVKQVAHVVRLKISGESAAVELDGLVRGPSFLGWLRTVPGFCSVTRQVCKSEWVYEVSVVFESASSFEAFKGGPSFDQLQASAAVTAMKKLAVGGQVYSGARVHDSL
eukprot:INCI2965.1.p2 GENE.INCI2965.1~~INCI2965.1.p2  ORF type:complete len:602 (+),score=112.81 INCI2965.1:203-2008(+)